MSGDSALSLVASQLKIMPALLQGAMLGCWKLTASCISHCSHAFKHRHLIFFKVVQGLPFPTSSGMNSCKCSPRLAEHPWQAETPGMKEDSLDFVAAKGRDYF